MSEVELAANNHQSVFLTIDDLAFMQSEQAGRFDGDKRTKALAGMVKGLPPRRSVEIVPRAMETILEPVTFFDDPDYYENVHLIRAVAGVDQFRPDEAAAIEESRGLMQRARRRGNIIVGTVVAAPYTYVAGDALLNGLSQESDNRVSWALAIGTLVVIGAGIRLCHRGDQREKRWNNLIENVKGLWQQNYLASHKGSPESGLLSIIDSPVTIRNVPIQKAQLLYKILPDVWLSAGAAPERGAEPTVANITVKPATLIQNTLQSDGKSKLDFWDTYLGGAARTIGEVAAAVQSSQSEIKALTGRVDYTKVNRPDEQTALERQSAVMEQQLSDLLFELADVVAARRKEKRIQEIFDGLVEHPEDETRHPHFEVIKAFKGFLLQIGKAMPIETDDQIDFLAEIGRYVVGIGEMKDGKPVRLTDASQAEHFFDGLIGQFGERIQLDMYPKFDFASYTDFFNTHLSPRPTDNRTGQKLY